MLILDHIKPKFLEDFVLNKKISNKLINLSNNGLYNVLLYGHKGCGKYTLLKCYLNTYFKEDIITTNTNFKINVNNVNKNIIIKSSIYHYEFNLDKYFISKKGIYISLLNYLTNSNCVNFDEEKDLKKIILIRNLHFANNEFINIIKNILEKKSEYIKFFITTNKLNNTKLIIPFLTSIRIPTNDKLLIKKFILDYKNEEKIKLTTKQINNIIGNDKINNLTDIFIKLEKSILNIEYIDLLNSATNKIIKYIEKKNIKNIKKIRDILYDLTSKNENISDIYIILTKYILKSEYKNKYELLDLVIQNNINYTKGYKNIIHIESLLINLMNLI